MQLLAGPLHADSGQHINFTESSHKLHKLQLDLCYNESKNGCAREGEMTLKPIKTYQAKTGIVTVTYFVEDDEYNVRHINRMYGSYWTKDRTEAIKHAQFLSRF